MGFMDELKKLTQPYDDDEDDFYEEADSSFAPSTQKTSTRKEKAESPKDEFENAFGSDYSSQPKPVKKRAAKQQSAPAQQRANGTSGAGGSIFGNFGDSSNNSKRAAIQSESPRQSSRPIKKRAADQQQVVLFNPKDFDESGELVTYITQGRSLVMALEGIPTETARRLLDFISGICFALNAKITPVSAKTYFVTPENVDILDAQALQKPNTDNQDDF